VEAAKSKKFAATGLEISRAKNIWFLTYNITSAWIVARKSTIATRCERSKRILQLFNARTRSANRRDASKSATRRTGAGCAYLGRYVYRRFDRRSDYFRALGLVSEVACRHFRTAVELESLRGGIRHLLAGSRRGSKHGRLAARRARACAIDSESNWRPHEAAKSAPGMSLLWKTKKSFESS
jgi:hypothetical protein